MTRPMLRGLLLLSLSAFALPVLAQTISVNKENKTIAITATDSATSIGFTTYGTVQDATYADCSHLSNRIFEAVLAGGATRQQIVSNEQHLNPVEGDDKLHFDKGARFVCSQSWTVSTSAGSAADLLHLSVLAGANNSGNIAWRVKD